MLDFVSKPFVIVSESVVTGHKAAGISMVTKVVAEQLKLRRCHIWMLQAA